MTEGKSFKKSVIECACIVLATALVCGLLFSCPVFAIPSVTYDVLGGINGSNFSEYSSPLPQYFAMGFTDNHTGYFISFSSPQLDSPKYGAFVIAQSNQGYLNCYDSSGNLKYQADLSGRFTYDDVLWRYNYFRLDSLDGVDTTNTYIYSGSSDGTADIAADVLTQFFFDTGSEPLPNEGYNSAFSLPAGNVAYVRVNGGNMLLEADFPEYSHIIGSPAWDSRSTYQLGVSSLPSVGTSFSADTGTLINWAKSSEGKNLLGQTKKAGYGLNNLSTVDNYIVIYNPANRRISSTGQGDVSPTILCQFTKLVDVKIYPLTQTLDLSTGETTSTSIDDYATVYDGVPTSDGETVVPTSPSGSSPVIGGSGADSGSDGQTIMGYLQSLKQTLDNFANSFFQLMQAPISHVQQLINAGSEYFGVIQGLYGWLPTEVQGIIKSGLIVSISIGVISVLL